MLTPELDTRMAHSARVWNYWLGGKDNYEIDRVVAGQLAKTFRGIIEIARQVRLFLFRAIRYLVAEAGVRQFLDIGTGLPTANNTHQIAQGIAPQARIVYVDNDHCKSGCSHVGIHLPSVRVVQDLRRSGGFGVVIRRCEGVVLV
jgi:hypothetical protein